jgi:hypothetical protein
MLVFKRIRGIWGIRGIIGINGIRGISRSHSHSHSLTITNTAIHNGGRPRRGRPPSWRRPKAASIVGDGEAVAVAVAAAYTPRTPCTYYTPYTPLYTHTRAA